MLDQAYFVSTALLVLVGLFLVTLALEAFKETQSRAMLLLAIGFTLVSAAAATTSISAFTLNFQGVQSLLVVNATMTLVGYLFVIGSLFPRRKVVS